MSNTNQKIAELLDAVADYVEYHEGAQYRTKQAESAEKIQKIASAYLDVHGEELPEDVRNKLASADDALLDLFMKQAALTGGSPDLLGAPVDDLDNVKIANHNPDDPDARFLNFLLS